jgi:hypothetical protein
MKFKTREVDCMGAEVIEGDGNHITLKVFGLLKPSEQVHVQHSLGEYLERTQDARILLTAEGFDGWEKTEEWGNMSISFPLRVDSHVARMAVISDPKWEEELLMFLGDGHREFPMRRFDVADAEKAKQWLETGEDA